MEATLRDAALYAGLAVLLAALSFLAPPERRKGAVAMAVIALAMLAGLWVLATYGGRFDDRTLYEIVREALLALLAVAVIRAVLHFATRIVLARLNVPSIVPDVLLGLALIAYALVRLNAVGVNIAGIVTTSAVITGAIAFSAQEVLGALWAGLALQADRTLRIGDWLRHDDQLGEIVTIRWRTTTIRTRTHEMVVIPNAQLIKGKVHVVARTGTTLRPKREIAFSVAYDQAPSRVVATVNEAFRLADVACVNRERPPVCYCTRFDDSGIAYSVFYEIEDLSRYRETDSEMLAHVYAALQRAGMRIPFPQRDVHLFQQASPDEARAHDLVQRLDALRAIELFAALTPPELTALAAAVRPCFYVQGDRLFRQGEPADSLFVLTHGRLAVFVEAADAQRSRLATIDPPGYVGEMGLLTGQPRGATVIAESDAECLRLDKSGFDTILRNRPEIVDELSQALARRQAENDAKLRELGHGDRAAGERGRTRELIMRIRRFFSLSHGSGDR